MQEMQREARETKQAYENLRNEKEEERQHDYEHVQAARDEVTSERAFW